MASSPNSVTDPIFTVVGLPRSGTIWTTRMIGQAIDSPTDTRYGGFSYKRDAVVWGKDRPGPVIRRLHDPKYDCPFILLVRDPRDLAVSQAYFFKRDKPLDVNGRFSSTLRTWLSDNRKWLRDERLITYTRYEDLQANPQRELSRIILRLKMADIPIYRMPTSKQIAQAVHDNSFDRMENHQKRRGTVGEWREHFNAQSIALWEKTKKEYEIVNELGYME